MLGLEAVKEVERLEASNLSSLGQAKGEREDYGLWSVETERQPIGSINKVMGQPKGIQSLKGARSSREPLITGKT